MFWRMTSDDDADTLARRLGRSARVTTAMGGLVARVAGEKFLGLKVERDQHARQLTEVLGGLKGPLMKVAQILSSIPGALPEEYARELESLQSAAPPMGWPFVKRRMANELGPDWQGRFAEFGHEAAAAASLGQVHRARLHDGRAVACKLQYPDMQSAVEADLKQLKLVMGVFEAYDKAVSTGQVQDELAARLREELDYRLEARHIGLYREMLAGQADIAIPEPVTDLSTNRLLTMTWLEGAKLTEYLEADLETRNRLASALFRAWYLPLYHFGIIHGDPHPGNYMVRPDLGINLLDFGCIRVFPPKFVKGSIDLYRSLVAGDNDLAVEAYESWGFKILSREMLDVLNTWAAFLYAPLLEDKERLIGELDHGIYGRETAEKVHGELRRLGGVNVPREFVFMDRAALGLGSIFLRMRAELNWHREYLALVDGFTVETLAARQADLLTRHGFPAN
jgi:predicted unusual protein kinase regulating ubiquinone biosynthesis (AarF/ABC1/UbiB family)